MNVVSWLQKIMDCAYSAYCFLLAKIYNWSNACIFGQQANKRIPKTALPQYLRCFGLFKSLNYCLQTKKKFELYISQLLECD